LLWIDATFFPILSSISNHSKLFAGQLPPPSLGMVLLGLLIVPAIPGAGPTLAIPFTIEVIRRCVSCLSNWLWIWLVHLSFHMIFSEGTTMIKVVFF
jgi:hypothetical protein